MPTKAAPSRPSRPPHPSTPATSATPANTRVVPRVRPKALPASPSKTVLFNTGTKQIPAIILGESDDEADFRKLKFGGVHVLLSYSGDVDAKENEFVWELFLHKGAGKGVKYSIIGDSDRGWHARHVETDIAFRASDSPIVFWHVATIPNFNLAASREFDMTVKTHDGDLNDPKKGVKSSRVWMVRVLGSLQKGKINGRRILDCEDVLALRQEIEAFGTCDDVCRTALRNAGVPLGKSSLCNHL